MHSKFAHMQALGTKFIRFLLLILFSCLALPSVSLGQDATPPQLAAENGYMDLGAIDWSNHLIRLDGDWSLIWGSLVPPEQWHSGIARVSHLPHSWSSMLGSSSDMPGQGVASYRLQLSGLSDRERMGLYIPEISTAFRLFANRQLVASGGVVSETLDEIEAYSGDQWALLPASVGGKVTLVLQVANAKHFSGGAWQSLTLGKASNIAERFNRMLVYEGVVAGLMLIMALLLLLEFAVDTRDRAGLWLGLFACVLGLRISISSHGALYWLFDFNFPWEWHIRLVYITMLLTPVFFFGWLRSCYPRDIHRRTLVILSIPYLASALLCLALEIAWFTALLHIFSLLILASVLIGSGWLLRALVRKRKGAWFLTLGLLCPAVAVVHDVLLVNREVQGEPWMYGGLVVFVLAQSINFLMFRVWQRRQIESLSRQLTQANRELEIRVSERTQDLKDKAEALQNANAQLQVLANIDALTGLLNRRAFIEQMKQLTGLHSQVAMLWIDLDKFKEVNDNFGHAAGDEVLRQFGALLRSLRRGQDRMGRLGGEEFALLLVDCDLDGAQRFVHRLFECLKDLQFTEWPEIEAVTASVGISVGSLRHDRWEELMSAADHAMYEVKHSGRNGFRVA